MERVDLLVVGGGILGVLTAWQAVHRHPGWTVRVVERDRVAAGATGYSAGLSFPLARTRWQEELVEDSLREFEHLGVATRDVTTLWVIARDRVDELADRLVGTALPANDEQLAAMRRAYPDLVVHDDERVMTTDRRCFYGYPGQAAEHLANGLRAADPSAVWEGVEVRELVRGPAGWRAVLSDGGVIEARRVVVAVGPWSPSALLPSPDLPLRVKKVTALHIGHTPPPDAPCVVFWADDAFVLPLAERGHCLFSHTNTTWGIDPSGRIELTGDDVRQALGVLAPRSAELAARRIGGRAFCDSYTPDFVPLLHREPGVAVVGGCSGSGFRLAPGIANAALAAVRQVPWETG